MFKQTKPREPLAELALFDYATGMLARRMRTERELRTLMQRRAAPGDEGKLAIEAVVLRLKALNYLSDTRFAADYTRLRKENEKYGRRRVQQDLAAKGVPSALATRALNEAYAEVDEAALARDYIARKRIKRPETEKESARAMGRLLRAGFSSATVFKVLREWGIDAEEFDIDESAGSQ